MARTRSNQIQLQGFPKLLSKLDRVGKTEAKKTLRKTLRKGGKIVQKAAKRMAPEDDTGALRRFIKARALKRSRKRIGIIVSTGTYEQLGIARSAYYYPSVLEYGGEHVTPQPFMRPALDQNKSRVMRMLESDLRRELGKVWSK